MTLQSCVTDVTVWVQVPLLPLRQQPRQVFQSARAWGMMAPGRGKQRIDVISSKARDSGIIPQPNPRLQKSIDNKIPIYMQIRVAHVLNTGQQLGLSAIKVYTSA